MVEQIVSLFNVGLWNNEAVFIQAFQDVVFKFTSGKTADLYSFLKWWDKSGVKQCISTPENPDAFRIMTIHKSKGLDFKVVIIPFANGKSIKNRAISKMYFGANRKQRLSVNCLYCRWNIVQNWGNLFLPKTISMS